MKLLISEEQKKGLKTEFTNLVNEKGVLWVVSNLGIPLFELAKITELPIKGDTFRKPNEIVVGDLLPDLVYKNNKYKICELVYDFLEGTVQWYCKLMDEDNYYSVTVYATPYWHGDDTTPVDLTNIKVTPKDSPKNKEYELSTYGSKFYCPSLFNDVDELIKWFENVYKPKTYSNILDLVEKFKSKEL